MAATVVTFGEFLPDLPALNHPGLIEAKNVLPRSGSYEPFPPLVDTQQYQTVTSQPYGGIWAFDYTSIRLYYGDRTSLNVRDTTNVAWTNVSSTVYSLNSSTEAWSFTQFERLVIAATPSVRLQCHTILSAGSFTLLSTSGEAPFSEHVGRIGEFVVALNNRQTTTAAVDISARWCAISDSRNWPTPNSATAIATQSGEQFLNESEGRGSCVIGNDQFGIIFQETAITRMTYVGGVAVFQFDKISAEIGTPHTKSIVPIANKFYFIAGDGVYVTDGVTIRSISAGKIDEWLFDASTNHGISDSINRARGIWGAVDIVRKIIMWGINESFILIYNYDEDRFTWALENQNTLLTYPSIGLSVWGRITAFDPDNSYKVGNFVEYTSSFAAGTLPAGAVLTTGDIEINPGGRAFVSGLKPNVEAATSVSVPTAPTLGVRVGARDVLTSAVTFGATLTPTTRTGFADCRVDAKYLRAELTINGKFSKASGLEFRLITTGDA